MIVHYKIVCYHKRSSEDQREWRGGGEENNDYYLK